MRTVRRKLKKKTDKKVEKKANKKVEIVVEQEIEEYSLVITKGIKCACWEIDPIGVLCNPERCLTCSNAKVKIIRVKDNVVMREE